MNKKIIIIILVLLTIAGLFWIIKYGKLKPKEGQEIQQSVKQEPVNNSENFTNVGNWKTYTNKNYGFKVQYPEDWKVYDEEKNIVKLNSPENERSLEKIKNGEIYGEGYMMDVNISYYKSISEEPENKANHLNAFTLSDFVNKHPLFSDKKKITIAGSQDAWEIIRGGFNAYYAILIERRSHLYEILFGNVEKKEDLKEIHKKIITSFEFID
jgi:hypothetical protein